MTREEAIVILKNISWQMGSVEREQNIEAIDMAIEALQADTTQGIGRYENAMQKLREMPKYLNGVKAKQIKKISTDRPSNVLQEKNPTPIEDYMTGKSCLVDRPSGEWIRWYEDIEEETATTHIPHAKCSKCGIEQDPYTTRFISYCPNCGARMKGGNK